jgi:tetratricopeptide (TPR) repeat protein
MRYLSIIFLVIIFSASLSAESDASFYLRKGKIELQNDMFDFAMENLEYAYRLDPSLFEAATLLGDLHIRKKNRLRALAYYTESLSLHDEQADTHVKVGELDDFYARYDDALTHFTRAMQIDPENYMAMIGTARIVSIKGDPARADALFQSAYELNKEKSSPSIRIADGLYTKKKYTNAIGHYSAALSANPADRDLYFTLSSIYQLIGQNRNAAALLERLAYLRPHDERAWVQLAHIYYSKRMYKKRRHEIDEAIKSIEKAIVISPDNAEHHLFAAELYDLINDSANARSHRARAAELEEK